MKGDFKDFLNAKKKPPRNIDRAVLSMVQNDLNSNYFAVYLKLIIIQAFIGLITLSFCPQFNLSLTNNYDLFHYFHHNFGEKICLTICGSIFVGSGSFFAAYLLSKREVQKIRQNKALTFLSLSGIFVAIFTLIGAKVYFNIAVFWFIGAAVSGITFLELSYFLKQKFV